VIPTKEESKKNQTSKVSQTFEVFFMDFQPRSFQGTRNLSHSCIRFSISDNKDYIAHGGLSKLFRIIPSLCIYPVNSSGQVVVKKIICAFEAYSSFPSLTAFVTACNFFKGIPSKTSKPPQSSLLSTSFRGKSSG